jgi:hypothetical protein
MTRLMFSSHAAGGLAPTLDCVRGTSDGIEISEVARID